MAFVDQVFSGKKFADVFFAIITIYLWPSIMETLYSRKLQKNKTLYRSYSFEMKTSLDTTKEEQEKLRNGTECAR